MVISINLFVKIFKKLIYHTDIRECKIKILHRFLIEFILKEKIEAKKLKVLKQVQYKKGTES